MIEVIKLFPKYAYHFLALFFLPFILMSCVTPSQNIYKSDKNPDRFEMMVVYISKTIADNPKYKTPEGKQSVKSLKKFIGFLENQVKENKISRQRAADVLSEVFSTFENNKYKYKSAKKLYKEHEKNYHQLDYSPPDTNNPWPPEEEPLM